MARTIKKPAERRNDILNSAKKLIYSVGYENMTIQSILEDLKIPKGLFYHYFSSKEEMVLALLEKISIAMEEVQNPVLSDPNLTALDKIHSFFVESAKWKLANKQLFLQLSRTWFSDSNLVVREKSRKMVFKRIAPKLSRIIEQGIAEKTMQNDYPEQAANIVLAIIYNFQENLFEQITDNSCQQSNFEKISQSAKAYSSAIERILGAPENSCRIIDFNLIKSWFADLKTKKSEDKK